MKLRSPRRLVYHVIKVIDERSTESEADKLGTQSRIDSRRRYDRFIKHKKRLSNQVRSAFSNRDYRDLTLNNLYDVVATA